MTLGEKMTDTERELMRLILSEVVRLLSLSPARDWPPTKEQVDDSIAVRDLKSGFGVRVCGQWLGTSAAARQARKRGLVALELLGFITLHHRCGERVTHVAMTKAGIALMDDGKKAATSCQK